MTYSDSNFTPPTKKKKVMIGYSSVYLSKRNKRASFSFFNENKIPTYLIFC